MKNKNIWLIIAIIAIIAVIIIIENPFKQRQEVDLENYGTDINDLAPNLKFKTPIDETVSFSDYKGKVLIVNAWTDWCPFCKEEMPDMQQVADENPDNVAVLFIHRTATESASKASTIPQEYFSKRGIELTSKVVLDLDDTFYNTFFGFGMPVTLFIDKNGIIRDRKVGPMGIDEIRQRVENVMGMQLETSQVDLQDEVKTLPDGTKYIVHPNEILSGGPPKDGIPSIDNPKFISVEEADEFLIDNDIVFGVNINGEARVYPKRILVWHEIVNDKFVDKPVLITYCPLCGTAIAYERKLPDGSEVEFGTSGKLWKSNLVMYDRKTDTYWSQVLGKAIVGQLAGYKLNLIPIDTVLYKDWKELHPDTKVLSRDTGFIRNYNLDPYGDYYSNTQVSFGATFDDTRLHPKSMISGINVNGKTKAYSVTKIKEVGILNDEFANVKILVTIDPSLEIRDFEINPVKIFNREIEGNVLEFEMKGGKLIDKQTQSEWNFNGMAVAGEYQGKKLLTIPATSSMWFSWLAANQDTQLYY